MRLPLPLIVLGVASAVLGAAVHGLAANPDKALVYCPAGIDSAGCEQIVAALSGPEGPFPGGVDRGYDGTAGTVDLATADLSPYAVFIIPSLADDPDTKPYDLLRSSRVAYGLSVAVQGRLVVWSGTPDQGSADRPEKDQLIRNLAVWARAGTANPGTGLVVLQDHSADAAARYGWLTGFAGLAVRADLTVVVYDSVVALTDAAREILNDGSGQLAYPNMASFGLEPPAAGAGAAADARGGSAEGQVVLVTAPQRLASVQTDKAEYSPGEPVTFTGSGWEPGEGVTLLLHEDAMIHPDRTLLATADESGNIVNNEFAPEPHDAGVTFYVTAQGQTSGLLAQATFIDGALPSNVKLQQWETLQTGNWTMGTLNTMNSDYSEGEVVPFRLDVGSLATSGNPYTFSVCRDFQSGTKRGYLFLAPFNTSRAAAPGGTITSTNGAFSGVDVTINSVTEVGAQGACTSTGARETMVSINSTNADNAFVLWGGHLAAPSDVFEGQPVGSGNGSASFPGSSLQMKLLSPNKTVSISTAAIKPAKATPTVATQIHDPNDAVVTSVPVGTTVHDKATVSGSGATPTGTVTFRWFTNGTCTGTAAATSSPQDLSSGMVDATGFPQTPATPGSYAFEASYSGDVNYASGNKPCELLTVGKASVTFSTAPQPSSATVGATLNDDATLAGGFGTLGGKITVKLFSPSDPPCQTLVYTDVITVSGAATYHTATQGDNPGGSTATALGTWNWTADYSGDPNNDGASSGCGAEPVTITAVPAADLTISKTDAPDPVLPGANLTYTLEVTNNGPSVATAVILTDPLPLLETTFQSLSAPSDWTCATPLVGTTGTVTCTTPSLTVGPLATFTLVVRVNPTTAAGTVITNTATVSSPTDLQLGNNSATAQTMVGADCSKGGGKLKCGK